MQDTVQAARDAEIKAKDVPGKGAVLPQHPQAVG